MVSTDGGPDGLRRSFLEAVRSRVLYFVLAYQDRVPKLAGLEERLYSLQDAETILAALLSIVQASGHKIYTLIDEYDTFANSLLSAGQEDLYSVVVEKTGFIRTLYRTLKGGTQSGAVGRIFITGVSPILLDDLASGFNIATNISQDHRMGALAGFTYADVERAVDEFLATSPDVASAPGIADRGDAARAARALLQRLPLLPQGEGADVQLRHGALLPARARAREWSRRWG